MTNNIPIREPRHIRRDAARKLKMAKVSDHFQAILGCLLGEDWTMPRLVEMVITSDGHMLGRCDGEEDFKVFLGEAGDLSKNIHGVAPVVKLDGDEIGFWWRRWLKLRGDGNAGRIQKVSDRESCETCWKSLFQS